MDDMCSAVVGATGGTISSNVNITGKANIGTNNTNARASAFVAGSSNSTDGNWATVGGRYYCDASAKYATVGGGQSNDALGEYSFIGGGRGNIANFQYATVGGGFWCSATDTAATVGAVCIIKPPAPIQRFQMVITPGLLATTQKRIKRSAQLGREYVSTTTDRENIKKIPLP